jgi:hypothetical protein
MTATQPTTRAAQTRLRLAWATERNQARSARTGGAFRPMPIPGDLRPLLALEDLR